MDPNRLLVLRAVRRAGGVLPAAQALHLTPSGISQHLRKLEAEAGIPLIDRSSRGGGRTVVLTPAGRALADQSEQLAAALASAEREVDRFRSQRGAVVKVGGFASVFDYLVVPTVVSLAVTDPGIELQIFEVDEASGVEQLATGQLDVLLSERSSSGGEDRPAGLVEVDLLRDPFRIVIPESWPETSTVEELLAAPWVLPIEHSAARRALERIATSHGSALDVRHSGREAATILSLVSAGLGAAIVPQSALSNQTLRRVRLYTGVHDTGARILTVLRPDDVENAGVTRLVDELLRQASNEKYLVPGD